MSKTNFNEPLHVAAAKSLRVAEKTARAKAVEAKLPLIFWKDGKIIRLQVSLPKRGKRHSQS